MSSIETTNHAPTAPPLLSAHDIRRVAVEAAVCPTTARKFLAGRPVRSTCRARIERALRALGIRQTPFARMAE
jgi:DNA-binding LacI/PurR family transcriptional regulator